MATSPGSPKLVTFLLANVPATVTEDLLSQLTVDYGGTVEWTCRFREGKALVRARFSEEDYDQFQTLRQLELDGNKLSVDKLWQHPIESSLKVTQLSPRITREILEGYFEAQGDVPVKTVVLSPNGEFATVELTDTLMIPYLTVKKHLIKQQPVLVEEVPLGMDDWYSQQGTPYLRVYGLPKMPEMSEKDVKQVLVSTFGNQLSSGDQGVLNVSMTSTSEAVVQFVDNNDCYKLADEEHEFLSEPVSVELCYKDASLPVTYPQSVPYLKVSGVQVMSGMDTEILLLKAFLHQLSTSDKDAVKVTLHADTGEAMVDFKNSDDCHDLAGRQLRFLGKQLTVELCYKTVEETFPTDEPQLSKDDHIPYLKLSGLPEVPPGLDVAKLLKQTFHNQLPKAAAADQGNIEVELTSASEAVVEFENSQSCLYLAKLSHDLLGKQFVTELCYKPVASNKVLVICNLPDLDPGVVKQSMEVTLRSKTKAVVDKFAVAENTAYITFCDSSGISDVMCDPLREFLGSPVDCNIVDKDEVDVFPDSIPRVLLIKALPDDMDSTTLKQCLQEQLKNAGYEVLDCVIEKTMAYIKFSDSAAVRKLVKSPPENSTFIGKTVKYHSILETEMPDFTPHVLLVRGLPRNQSVPSALHIYLRNSCGASPTAVDVSEGVARVNFEDGQAAKKIVACPPTTLFLGCKLQFSAVKDTSVVCETSEENDSHIHVPLSSDTVMVEGLPEYATENSLRKALEKKGLPLPASLHVVDEEQVAYLQFDNTEVVPSVIKSLSSSQLLGKRVVPKAISSNDLPSITSKEQLHLLSPNAKGGQIPDRKRSPSLPAKFIHNGRMPFKREKVAEEEDEEEDAGLSMKVISRKNREPSGVYSRSVVVRELPTDTKVESYVVGLYMHTIAGIESSNIKIGGPLAVVEFPEPVDVKEMRQKAVEQPFPVGHKVVHIEPLEESCQVLVKGFPSDQDYAVQMYLDRFQDSIESIERKSEDVFIVTFKKYEDVESVESKNHKVGNFVLSFSAYHSVLDELEQYKEPPPPPPQPEYTWGTMKRPLAPAQKNFCEHCISSFLGEQLQTVHAKITIEAKELKIEPLEEASQLQNWEDQVNNYLDDCLSDFTTAEQELNHDAVTKVWMKLEDFKTEHADLHYVPHVDSSTIKVAGSKKSVNAALQLISEVTETEVEMNKTFKLPPKHVKYLLKFHQREIEAIKPSVKIVEESARLSQLVVTGVKRSLDCLDTLVSEKLQLAHEEVLPLSTTAHKLLTSRRGTVKLTETLAKEGISSEVIYVVEKVNGAGGQLTLVSRNRPIVAVAIKYVKDLIVEKKIFLTPEKQRICTGDNLDWRSFIETHTNEHFLAIKVIGEEVVVVGEALTVPDIVKKVEKLLSEQTAVTSIFELPRAKWQVLRMNLFEKIEAVQKDRPSVQWTLPKSDVMQAKKVSISLRGDPIIVEHVKRSLELITNEVRTKEITLPPQTGLKQVVESMELKRHEFQEKYKAVVEIELNEPVKLATPFKARGQSGAKLLVKATTPAGVRVKIMTGDFAREQTDIVVNFVMESPNFHTPVLSALVKVGGSEVQQDLQSKGKLLVGTAHVCSRGRLPCSSLVHVVVPTYTANPRIFETVLSEALPQVIQVTSDCRRMVITPLTAAPFHCPVQVYADSILGALGTMFDYNTDVSDVIVFVESASCKDVFEETMKSSNYHVFPPVVDYRAANSSHSSTADLNLSLQRSVKIKKGSILDVQADVYVNSTNPELDMSKGELSQVFLKACGDKLQEEAKHYRPLQFGQVAVTSAKNLKAKSIYHVSLPDYKSPQSERKYRETIKTILRTAQGEGVSSIAIPSLGVANLNYPAKLAAEILFDEIVTFHAQNRTAIQLFVFVIFRDEDYKIFKQEHETRVTKAASLASRSQSPKDSLHVNIVNGDLAEEKSDVVVNSTSANMSLSVNRISQAISKKAGPQMQTICSSFVQAGMSLEDATIIPTPASGSLKCRKVYHAYVEKKKVGTPPIPKQTDLIQKVVQNCLCKAEEEKMASISFPIFCLGVGGYTVRESGSPMLEAVKKFTQKSPKYLNEIRIVVLDDKMFCDFKEFFLKFFPTGVQTQPQRGHSWSPRQLFQYMPKEEGVSIAIAPQKSLPPQPREQRYYCQVQDCGATVRIYCTEPSAISNVEQSLKLHLAENIVTESVDLGELATLLGDNDLKELYDIGNQSGVAVKLQRTMERLLIDGEVTAVGKACNLIHRKVLKFLEITGELKVYEWVSIDDSGTSVPYPSEICFQLENACKNNVPSVDAVIDDVHLVIDHNSMTETDKSSGIKRVVKRTRKPISALPSNWTPQPNDDNGKPKVCAYIEVAEGTPEYSEATHRFKQTLGSYKVTIVKVQRVQNPGEYMRYEAIKTSWRLATDQGNVKEETVFHGTKRANIEPISKTGFNRIFAAEANAALYGSGVYFARNSSYSVQDKYSVPESSGEKNILVCSLLVSQFTKGTKSMKIAPNIPGKEVLYDTLVDNIDNPTIFVAMKDFQAYPNYWIQFKVDK